MSIELTELEKQEIAKYFAGGQYFDDSVTTAGENELVRTLQLESKRTIHYIYHLNPDSVTVFSVEEAPPVPVPEPMEKLASFLEANPDVKELLGL